VQGQKEPKPGSVAQLPEATGQRMQSTLHRLPTKTTKLPSDQTVGPPVTSSRSFVTGGVVLHLDVITTDHWVLEGYCLELQEQLSLRAGSQEKRTLIEGEIQQKTALQEVQPSPSQFVSHLFLIPKKDRSYRPVLTGWHKGTNST